MKQALTNETAGSYATKPPSCTNPSSATQALQGTASLGIHFSGVPYGFTTRRACEAGGVITDKC